MICLIGAKAAARNQHPVPDIHSGALGEMMRKSAIDMKRFQPENQFKIDLLGLLRGDKARNYYQLEEQLRQHKLDDENNNW